MTSSSGQSRAPRTNTGCLTCRRRHVRCDESKPICSNCNHLTRDCEWGGRHVPLRERKEQKIREAKARAPRPIEPRVSRPTPSDTELSLDGQLISTQVAVWPAPGHYLSQLDVYEGDGHATNLDLPGLEATLGDFSGATDPTLLICPSPLNETRFGSTLLLASLPSHEPITKAEWEALDYYHTESTFGFGNKSPAWSTHAVLWKITVHKSPAVLHLLFAASQAELGWRHGFDHPLLDSAENNYRLGRRLLEREVTDAQIDPLVVMASFWFLFLHQRRLRLGRQRIRYAELSNLIAEYIRAGQLHKILASGGSDDPVWPPARKAMLARLVSWLFWADVQQCFQGEGGSMAKQLARSVPPNGLLDLYEASKEALNLNWAEYPDDELVDDIKNSGALELIHHTWVLVQEINDAADERCYLDPDTSSTIKAKIDALRRKSLIQSVIRLTGSTTLARDRLMLNSDWAVANYFSLCIYHFRCSLTQDEDSFTSPVGAGIADIVSGLLILIQKSVASADSCQSERMQWPLFWVGIETTDPFKQNWVLEKLRNEGLREALQCVMLVQAAGVRVAMARIREICKATCAGLPDAGLGTWGV
ncbi:hypothetical protein MFIFM68171_05002 [Madurella fahalii]|uniref:Zn(2)-C6 fungal-type domain-containing protein n=1 Tax=Madurella fahalii TaxID=1157608 RepID=A0ABQ0GAK0_9PEZI